MINLFLSFVKEVIFMQPHKFEGKYHKFQVNEKLRKKEVVSGDSEDFD